MRTTLPAKLAVIGGSVFGCGPSSGQPDARFRSDGGDPAGSDGGRGIDARIDDTFHDLLGDWQVQDGPPGGEVASIVQTGPGRVTVEDGSGPRSADAPASVVDNRIELDGGGVGIYACDPVSGDQRVIWGVEYGPGDYFRTGTCGQGVDVGWACTPAIVEAECPAEITGSAPMSQEGGPWPMAFERTGTPRYFYRNTIVAMYPYDRVWSFDCVAQPDGTRAWAANFFDRCYSPNGIGNLTVDYSSAAFATRAGRCPPLGAYGFVSSSPGSGEGNCENFFAGSTAELLHLAATP